MNLPILQVTLNDADQPDFLLRTSSLDTKSYGILLATLARQVGAMMEVEGGHPQQKVVEEIVAFFNAEIVQQVADVNVHRLN
jgi:hypothetical protein